MIYTRDLSPKDYTICATGEGLDRQTAEAAVRSCDRNYFALVRNVFTGGHLHALHIRGLMHVSAAAGRASPIWRSHELQTYAAEVPTPVSMALRAAALGHLILPLNEAAKRVDSTRMPQGIAPTIGAFQVNKYGTNGRIGRHWDDHPGAAVVIGITGVGRARLSIPRPVAEGVSYIPFQNLATVDIEPGDALIMPAKSAQHGGMYDQAWHEVDNITPDSGNRMTLAMVYDAH